MDSVESIEGFLIDLDGVLYVDDTPIHGAVEAINTLKATGYPCRFLTNSSTMCRATIVNKLQGMGFHIETDDIFSAPQAALRYIQKKPNAKCKLFISDDLQKDFAHTAQTQTLPSFVVIGDIGPRWTYDMLNEILQDLLQGAELIAIHKNRFWQTQQGLCMDIGGFIAALEYASNKPARIMGKPNPDFFEFAVADLGLPKAHVAVIGDDIDSDVAGAQKAGLAGILCKTGKYRDEYCKLSNVRPDAILESIKYLPYLMKRHENAKNLQQI